jgi:hypothetical protein
VQKDKQRSTKHTYKTKDRVTRTPLKPGVNSGAPEGFAIPAPLMTPIQVIFVLIFSYLHLLSNGDVKI